MKIQNLVLGIMAFACLNSATQAAFIEDTKGQIYLKNFYFDRDYSDQTADLSNWSQAVSLFVNSGYTDTPIQMGLDLSARYAYRLSPAKDIVDNVMPYDEHAHKQAQDQLKLGGAIKLKYSNTELKIGEFTPKLPIVHTDVAMQLPTTFLGGMIESTDIKNTKITTGRLTKVSGRNAEDYSKFQLSNGTTKAKTDALNFIGADYDYKDQQFRYFFADLENIYNQHFLSYEYRHAFNENLRLKSNFYMFDTYDSGDSLEGNIDSLALATIHMLTYGNHTFSAGYKHMSGDTKFPLLANWVPQLYLANWSVGTYMQQDEHSWQIRYDYDFKETPFNGLKSTLRYYYGDNIKTSTGNDGVEKELDFILNYEFSQQKLKGFGLSWLIADYKNSTSKDYLENRLSATYTLNF
ncbi:OprD family outer membrane porin [Acinetobacter sp. ANC 3781]